MTHKAVLLLPRSVIYPSIGFDIMAGIKAGLATSGISDVDIATDSIGLGNNDKQIYAQCEKLLLGGANIIAGYVNPMTAEKLNSLFVAANAIFLALDAGYHYRMSQEKLSNVFYVSLQGALCSRVTTKRAADDGIKKMAFASSYYEAGYRTAFAFYKCMEEEGGAVTLNHITDLSRANFSLCPVIEQMKEERQTDGLFASFCGDMAQDFFSAAEQDSAFNNFPVYGASFLAEEQWLAKSPYPGTDIKVCVPWASTLGNDENLRFLSDVGGRSSVFSLLGWEAGIITAKVMNAGNTEKAIKELEGYAFNSPRGEILLDKDTHQSYAPVYNGVVTKDEATGNCRLVVEQASDHGADQRQKMDNDLRNLEGGFSSWLNVYGCLES